jgi:predicted DCC family thiol-disulfide oxidoreductase YuxK
MYDPDCGFCRVCVAVILRWDRERRLRPVPGEELDSWQLIEPNWSGSVPENGTIPDHLDEPGRAWSAGTAFSPLLRLLPGGAALARVTDRFPNAADRGYRFVADRRSFFGTLMPARVKRWADRVISESERDGR